MTVLLRQQDVRLSSAARHAITRAATQMLLALGLEHAELSLLVCNDATIRRLNSRYRRKHKPTDVLAFALHALGPRRWTPGVGPAALVLGDIVISMETAKRQAKIHRKSTLDEVTFLIAHGLLHLLGMDHQTAADDRRMRARTDCLLAAAKAVG